MKKGRHAANDGRMQASSLFDVEPGEWLLLVVGLPAFLLVWMLWDWQPIVAIAVVGTVLAAAIIGMVLLLRRQTSESWDRRAAALLALVLIGVLVAVLESVASTALVDALLWPFRQLANGFE